MKKEKKKTNSLKKGNVATLLCEINAFYLRNWFCTCCVLFFSQSMAPRTSKEKEKEGKKERERRTEYCFYCAAIQTENFKPSCQSPSKWCVSCN